VPNLKLKHGIKARALQGHPWVFAGEVQKLLPSSHDGEVIECRDVEGFLLGSGIYNSKSQIVWRRFSRQKSMLEHEELKHLISQAISHRMNKPARRLIWSEADHLPGLIVDQYESVLVIQTLTFGMEKRLGVIKSILLELIKPDCIVLKNDVPSLKLEGVISRVETIYGNPPAPFWIKIGEIEFQIDVLNGQKTGFYLDQQEEYRKIAACAKGRVVLDAFCNQGGFALHCLKSGAKHVVGVEVSESNVLQAQKNAEKNGLALEFWMENVFDYFKKNLQQKWDLIILDPPSFTKNKTKLQEAARGYKELNLRALQTLNKGGLLATYCCSHHVSKEYFLDVVTMAAADAKRDVRIIRYCTQSEDHPVLLNMPESEYLHGLVLEVE
jgi:23S rRNA (cytosine1962-C5)-methyltransferase